MNIIKISSCAISNNCNGFNYPTSPAILSTVDGCRIAYNGERPHNRDRLSSALTKKVSLEDRLIDRSGLDYCRLEAARSSFTGSS